MEISNYLKIYYNLNRFIIYYSFINIYSHRIYFPKFNMRCYTKVYALKQLITKLYKYI